MQRRDWLTAAGLVALVGIAFWNALPSEFTFDSVPIIRDHALLREGSPWWRLFGKTYWGDASSGGLYRPGVMLTYWVEKRVLGFESPAPHAVVNIALHAVVVLLLWRIAMRWSGSRTAAAVAAAIYAVHPVATEVIPNLVGRADLLAAGGVFGALLCWERSHGRHWLPVIGAAACWAVALLAKESAIVLLGIVAIRDLWRISEEAGVDAGRSMLGTLANAVRMTARRRWPHYAVLLGVAGLWGLAYWNAVRQGPPMFVSALANPLVASGIDQQWMTAVLCWGLYLRLALLPVWMSADYSFAAIPAVESPADLGYLAALAAVIVYCGITLWLWRRGDRWSNAAAMGLTFAPIAISPVSNVVVIIGTIFAERLLYMPLAGICIALGVGGAAVLHAMRQRVSAHAARAGWAVAILIGLSLLTFRTWQRNGVWRDHMTLWTQTVLDAPDNHKPHHVLARTAQERGDLDTAVREVESAAAILLGLPPDYAWGVLIDAAAIHIERAEALRASGERPTTARADLERAVELMSAAYQAFQQGGAVTAYWESAALDAVQREVKIAADEPLVRVLVNLGDALSGLGAWDDAAVALSEAAAHRPKSAEIQNALGRALAQSGRLEEGETALIRATELAPAEQSYLSDLERVRVVLRERRDQPAGRRP